MDFRYAHVKRDGHMIIVEKNSVGAVKCYSKNYNVKDLSWHPVFPALVTRVPTETTLYCELWKPGAVASYISSGLVQQDKGMKLEVFAVPIGLPYSLELAHVSLECRRWGLDFVPFYDVRDEPLSLGKWDPSTLQQMPLHEDSEGFVLKNSNLSEPYKYKPFKSADLRITGVNPGKGKYEGQVGAIICSLDHADSVQVLGVGQQGAEVANVSGMSDGMRKWMTAQHGLGYLIGKICEVRYQYVNSQGRLRHASFVRMRDDKDVADYELS